MAPANAWNKIKSHFVLSSLALAILLAVGAFFAMKFRPAEGEFVNPKRGKIVEAVYGIGTVMSTRQFHGRVAQSDGIQQVFTKEGASVAKGSKIILFEDGSVIRSPFAGTVTSLPFYSGENILPGMVVVTIQDLKDLFVRATLEQQGALRVRPGQPVRLNFESFRNQTFDGWVRSVYPQENQFLIDIDVESLPPNVLPSMTADVAIEIAKRDGALLVPMRAISSGKLIVRRNGKNVKVAVEIGTTDGESAEVLSGEVGEKDLVLIPGP